MNIITTHFLINVGFIKTSSSIKQNLPICNDDFPSVGTSPCNVTFEQTVVYIQSLIT